jgi:hypothetical protein
VPEEVERYSQDRARDDILAVLDALCIERAHMPAADRRVQIGDPVRRCKRISSDGRQRSQLSTTLPDCPEAMVSKPFR